MESSYLHTASVSVDKGSSFVLSPLKQTTLQLFLAAMASQVALVMMIAWSGLTQKLYLWLPYIYLLRTMRSHTLQSDWSARHSPSQWWLWALRHQNVPLCPSHGLVGAEGRHDTTFSPLTPLCVWFWGVVIQGHGVSSHDPQTFLLWLICPPLALLPPPSLYEPAPNTFHPISAPQSSLVTSSFDHPLPIGVSWGA